MVKRICKEMTYVFWISIFLQIFIFKSKICFMFVNKYITIVHDLLIW
jgi:hypothetical protein